MALTLKQYIALAQQGKAPGAPAVLPKNTNTYSRNAADLARMQASVRAQEERRRTIAGQEAQRRQQAAIQMQIAQAQQRAAQEARARAEVQARQQEMIRQRQAADRARQQTQSSYAFNPAIQSSMTTQATTPGQALSTMPGITNYTDILNKAQNQTVPSTGNSVQPTKPPEKFGTQSFGDMSRSPSKMESAVYGEKGPDFGAPSIGETLKKLMENLSGLNIGRGWKNAPESNYEYGQGTTPAANDSWMSALGQGTQEGPGMPAYNQGITPLAPPSDAGNELLASIAGGTPITGGSPSAFPKTIESDADRKMTEYMYQMQIPATQKIAADADRNTLPSANALSASSAIPADTSNFDYQNAFAIQNASTPAGGLVQDNYTNPLIVNQNGLSKYAHDTDTGLPNGIPETGFMDKLKQFYTKGFEATPGLYDSVIEHTNDLKDRNGDPLVSWQNIAQSAVNPNELGRNFQDSLGNLYNDVQSGNELLGQSLKQNEGVTNVVDYLYPDLLNKTSRYAHDIDTGLPNDGGLPGASPNMAGIMGMQTDGGIDWGTYTETPPIDITATDVTGDTGVNNGLVIDDIDYSTIDGLTDLNGDGIIDKLDYDLAIAGEGIGDFGGYSESGISSFPEYSEISPPDLNFNLSDSEINQIISDAASLMDLQYSGQFTELDNNLTENEAGAQKQIDTLRPEYEGAQRDITQAAANAAAEWGTNLNSTGTYRSGHFGGGAADIMGKGVEGVNSLQNEFGRRVFDVGANEKKIAEGIQKLRVDTEKEKGLAQTVQIVAQKKEALANKINTAQMSFQNQLAASQDMQQWQSLNMQYEKFMADTEVMYKQLAMDEQMQRANLQQMSIQNQVTRANLSQQSSQPYSTGLTPWQMIQSDQWQQEFGFKQYQYATEQEAAASQQAMIDSILAQNGIQQ